MTLADLCYKTYQKLMCIFWFWWYILAGSEIMFLFIIRLLTWSQKWSFRDDLDSGLCWYLLIGRSHPVEKDWDDSPSLIVQERCHGIPMDFRVASWLGGPVIFLPRPYLPQERSKQIPCKEDISGWPDFWQNCLFFRSGQNHLSLKMSEPKRFSCQIWTKSSPNITITRTWLIQ